MNAFLIAGEVLLAILLLFNLALTLAVIRRVNTGHTQTPEGLHSGDPVPAFSAKTLAGEVLTANDLEARRTALVFITPTCAPCREAMKDYLRFASLARDRGPDFMLISKGDTQQTRTLVGDGHVTVLISSDGDDLFRQFKVPATPYFALVEAGKVLTSGSAHSINPAWRDLMAEWPTGDLAVAPAY